MHVQKCSRFFCQKNPAMYQRYSDLFTREEELANQQKVQEKRREWRAREAARELQQMSMPVLSTEVQ